MSKTMSNSQTVQFGLVKKESVSIETPQRSLNEFLNGRSKFVQGRQFKVTGWDYAYIRPADGSDPAVNTNVFPVLTTDIGDDTNIWLRSYVEPKLDASNRDVVADGAADDIIRKIIAEKGDESEEVALDALAEALKDQVLVVRRKRYIGMVRPEGKASYTKTMSIPCFDIKK